MLRNKSPGSFPPLFIWGSLHAFLPLFPERSTHTWSAAREAPEPAHTSGQCVSTLTHTQLSVTLIPSWAFKKTPTQTNQTLHNLAVVSTVMYSPAGTRKFCVDAAFSNGGVSTSTQFWTDRCRSFLKDHLQGSSQRMGSVYK